MIAFLDHAVYSLLFFYAGVALIGLDRLPSGLVSVAAVLALLRHIRSPLSVKVEKPLLFAGLAYALSLVLSGIVAHPAVYWGQVWSFLDRMLPLPLVYFFCRTGFRLRLLLVALAGSALFTSCTAMYQSSQSQYNLDLRVKAFFDNPVPMSEHLLLFIAFILPVFFANTALSNRIKIMFGSALVFSLITCVSSGTRAVWISVLAVGLLFSLLPLKKPRSFWVGSIAAIVMVILLYNLSPAFHSRMDSISDFHYQSNSERILVWRSAWQMFVDHPLFGVGPDNFQHLYLTTYYPPEAKEPWLRDAHHNYLHILAETGIAGFIAYFGFLAILLQMFWKQMKTAPAPAWACSGFLVIVAFCAYGFMNTMYARFWPMRLFYLLIGIALAYNQVRDQALNGHKE